ncbi:MAG: T9SS type A sorting domain-containing protein [Chitinophagaceae bacterium]|nr:T9SS type A sorting domain-containing protein [Chitinophagaceae bacterium]
MKSKSYFLTALLFLSKLAIAQHFNSPTVLSSTGNSGTGANIDVVYYRCDWTIDPSVSKVITGTVTTYFKTTTANVSSLTIDLNKASFNNVSLVPTYHGITCAKSFPASGSVNILTITLPSTIVTSGTLDSISIAYSGTPPAVSGQAEGFQRKQDANLNWYIYTLSESYEDRDWWPCKADMQDKADSLDINLTVPNTYWVAANGKLVDSAINGANRTFKYKHRYPIASYLVAIGVAKYNRQYRGSVNIAGKNVPVIYYTFPDMTGGTLTTALARMDVSKTELVEFSNKYGPYPFADEKHGYYQFGWGGGMEHQTFSAMSAGSMSSWSVIAHELAHQWWGDKVSFATWSHLWLAEGFAQYSEALAAELIPAIGVTPASHLSSIKTTARATNTTPVLLSAASIANSNTIWTTNNDNAVYKRGAMIVSMLRSMLGDAQFFQGCKDYQADPLLAYKSATTADLQRNMENQMSGVNLTPFFNAWVNGSGTPSYTGNYYITGKRIQFRLTQTMSPVGNPFMPMPVVVKIANSGGTIDTSVVIYHYSPTQLGYAGNGMGPAGDDFITYDLSFVPVTITVDPDNKTMATGTLTSVGSPLSANILNFAATKTMLGNQLNLSLTSNEPIEKVVLLKSQNGTDFIDAGLMNKINTQGQQSNYQFTDVLPYSKLTFYRARIYTTGNVYYSAIVKVQEAVNNTITISPNPAADVVNISFANATREKVTVRVINADGKVVIESTTNNNFIHYDISNLSAGIYMAQALQNGQVSAAGKFVVRQ